MTKTNVANSKKVIALIALFAIMVTSVFALTITMPKSTASATEEPTLEFQIDVNSVDVNGTESDALRADGTAKALDMLVSGTPKVGIAIDTTFAINYTISKNDGIGESVWVPSYDSSKFDLVSLTTASGSNWEVTYSLDESYVVSSKDEAMLCEATGAFITVTYKAKENIVDLGKYTFGMGEGTEVFSAEFDVVPTTQEFNIYLRGEAEIVFTKPTAEEGYIAKRYDGYAVTFGESDGAITETFIPEGYNDLFDCKKTKYYINPENYPDGAYIFTKSGEDYVAVPTTDSVYTEADKDFIFAMGKNASGETKQFITLSGGIGTPLQSIKSYSDLALLISSAPHMDGDYYQVYRFARIATFSMVDVSYETNSEGAVTFTWYADNNGEKGASLGVDGDGKQIVPTNAGAYWVKVTVAQTDSYIETSGELRFVIDKAKVTKPAENLTKYTYNTTEQTYQVTLSNLYTVSGNKQTNAGEYKVTIALKDKDNYEWNDGSITDLSYDFVINKAKVTKPAEDTRTFSYTATEKIYQVALSALYTVNGDSKTDAGEYKVTIALIDTANYEWNDGSITDLSYDFVISKAKIVIYPTPNQSKVYGAGDPTFTYDYVRDTYTRINYGTSDFGNLYGTDTFTGKLAREQGETAGFYTYTIGDLSAGNNYEISVAEQQINADKFEIKTADWIIKFYTDSKVWDGEKFGPGNSARIITSGDNAGEYEVVGGEYYYEVSNAGAEVPAGIKIYSVGPNDEKSELAGDYSVASYYPICVYVPGDANHNATYSETKQVSINTRSVEIALGSTSKVYGDAGAPSFTIVSGGEEVKDEFCYQSAMTDNELKALVSLSVKDSSENIVTIGTLTDAGVYSVTIDVVGNNVGDIDFRNLDVVFSNTGTSTPQTYTINQRPVTITVDADLEESGVQSYSKEWDEADPETFTYTISYTGDSAKTALASGQAITGALSRESGEAVGTYAYAIDTLKIMSDSIDVSVNYDITLVGQFEITLNTKGLKFITENGLIVKEYDNTAVTVGTSSENIIYEQLTSSIVSLKWNADNNGEKGTELDEFPVHAGTYWVTISAPADTNYDEVSKTIKVIIARRIVYIDAVPVLDYGTATASDIYNTTGQYTKSYMSKQNALQVEYGWDAYSNTKVCQTRNVSQWNAEGGFFEDDGAKAQWDAMWTNANRATNVAEYIDIYNCDEYEFITYEKGANAGEYYCYEWKQGACEDLEESFTDYAIILHNNNGYNYASTSTKNNNSFYSISIAGDNSENYTDIRNYVKIIKNSSYFGDMLANGSWYYDEEALANKLTLDETTGKYTYSADYNGSAHKLVFVPDASSADSIQILYYTYDGEPSTAPTEFTNAGAIDMGEYSVKAVWAPKGEIADPFTRETDPTKKVNDTNFEFTPLEAILEILKGYWNVDFYTDNKYWDGSAAKKGTSARKITSGDNEGEYEVVGGEWYYNFNDTTTTVNKFMFRMSDPVYESGSYTYMYYVTGALAKDIISKVDSNSTFENGAYANLYLAEYGGQYNDGTNGVKDIFMVTGFMYTNPTSYTWVTVNSYSKGSTDATRTKEGVTANIADDAHYIITITKNSSSSYVAPSFVDSSFTAATSASEITDTTFYQLSSSGRYLSYAFLITKTEVPGFYTASNYFNSISSVGSYNVALYVFGDENHKTTFNYFKTTEGTVTGFEEHEINIYERDVVVKLASDSKVYGTPGSPTVQLVDGHQENSDEYNKKYALYAYQITTYTASYTTITITSGATDVTSDFTDSSKNPFMKAGEYTVTIEPKSYCVDALSITFENTDPANSSTTYKVTPKELTTTVTVSEDHKSQTVTVNGIVDGDGETSKKIYYYYFAGTSSRLDWTEATLTSFEAYNYGILPPVDRVELYCSDNYTFGYDTDGSYLTTKELAYAPSRELRYNDDSTKHDGETYLTGFEANDNIRYFNNYYFVDDATNGYKVTLVGCPVTDYNDVKYTFNGWFDDTTDGANKVTEITLKTTDVVVYANWTKNGTTVSYVYRLNGATSWTTLTWIPSGETEPVSSELLTESSTLRAIPSFLHNYWFATDGWHEVENYGKTGESLMQEVISTVPEDDMVLGCEFTLSTAQTGDINGDGIVSIADVTDFRKWYIGYEFGEVQKVDGKTDAETTAIESLWAKKDVEEVNNMFFIDRANVNGDTKKNLSDVVAMRMAIVGGYNYYMYKDINGINGQFVSDEEIYTTVRTLSELETALNGNDPYIKLANGGIVEDETEFNLTVNNRRVVIDLNDEGIACLSFRLIAEGNNSEITIKNGVISADPANEIIIEAPDGVLNVEDVIYGTQKPVTLNAASESIHFKGYVFVQGFSMPGTIAFGQVNIPSSAHLVIEENSVLLADKINVISDGVHNFSMEIKGGEPTGGIAEMVYEMLLEAQQEAYSDNTLTAPQIILNFVKEEGGELVADTHAKAFVETPEGVTANVSVLTSEDGLDKESDRLIDGEPDGYTHVANASELLEVFNEAYSADKLPAKLDNDITLSGSYYFLSNSTTLDLNGHKLTITSGKYGRLYIIDNATLTIDGTKQNSKVLGTLYVGDANKQGSLVIDGGDYEGYLLTAIQSNGSGTANITAKDATFKEHEGAGTAAYLPAPGMYNFTNCEFTGFSAVYVKSGIPHNYNNCKFYSTATTKSEYKFNGNGCEETGDAFIIDNCYYPGGNADVTFDANCKFYENGVEVDGATRYWYAVNNTNLNSALDAHAEIVHLDHDLATSLTQENMREGYALVGNRVIKNTLTCTVNSASELKQALSGKVSSIKLGADIQPKETLYVDYKLTLDLDGKTISPASNWAARTNDYANDSFFAVKRGGDLTVTGNGTIDAENNSTINAAIKMTAKGETANGTPASLTIENGTFKGYYYAICGNGNRHDTSITINGGNFSNYRTNDGFAVYHPQNGSLTINGGNFTGFSALYVKSGTLTIPADSTATFTATASELTAYSYNGNGANSTGDAIIIDNCFYPGTNATVNIAEGYDQSNITVTADGASKIATYWYVANDEQLNIAKQAGAECIYLSSDMVSAVTATPVEGWTLEGNKIVKNAD